MAASARATRKTTAAETPVRKPRTKKVVPAEVANEEQSQLAPVQADPVQAMMLVMAEMQKQIATQNAMMMKMLEQQGQTIQERFSQPPSGTTVVVAPEEVDESTLPPGSYRPGNNWIPWKPEDIEQFPKTKIVPYPIPNLVWPEVDEEGRQKIRIIKNDLECWLTVGEENEVSEFFAEVYRQSFENWKNLEKFKRTGGRGPWVHGGPKGENTWTYNTDVISFGMDENGRPVTIDTSIWDMLPPSAALPE